MGFLQFDLAGMMHCRAIDEEGFSCLRAPSHDGEHRWDRCGHTDPAGHHCALRVKHSGRHETPWYDSPSTPDASHTINYGGTERETGALADRATRIGSSYGWVERSRAFTPGLPWRLAALRPLSARFTLNGRLTVVFERKPTESQDIV